MKKLLFMIIGVLIAGNAIAQVNVDAGRFPDVMMLQPGLAPFDSVFINASGTTDETEWYGMWPFLSVDYLFTDDVTNGSVTSTLLFQQMVLNAKGNQTGRWITVDSSVVTTASDSWRTYKITRSGADIPPKPIWRISVASRSASADTCRLKYNGWNNQK